MKAEDYLSDGGKVIFQIIHGHCDRLGVSNDIDTFELSMLANSFDMYAESARICNSKGVSQKTKTGYSQVRAEYTVMKNEYQNILKHSPKFGLNPQDRQKLLKDIKQPEKKPDFNDI